MIERKTSRDLLVESLFELSLQRPIERITVKEVVENCHLSKATFYKHFSSIMDLRTKVFIEKLRTGLDDHIGQEAFSRHLKNYLSSFVEYGSIIVNWTSDGERMYSALQYSTDLYADELKRFATAKAAGEPLPETIVNALQFYSQAIVSHSVLWYRGGMTLPVEDYADFIIACMPDMLKPYLL